MQSFKNNRKHFLTIMLGEPLKLHSSTGDTVFHIPGRYLLFFTKIHIVYQICNCKSKTAFGPVSVPVIYLLKMNLEKEKFDDRLRIRQTLKDRIHEASIAQIRQSSYSHPLALTCKKLGQI